MLVKAFLTTGLLRAFESKKFRRYRSNFSKAEFHTGCNHRDRRKCNHPKHAYGVKNPNQRRRTHCPRHLTKLPIEEMSVEI